MRKLLTFCLLAMFAIGLSSCKETKPEFKFQLTLSGDVQDAPTQIHSDFNVNVSNSPADVQLLSARSGEVQTVSIESEQGTDALQWLDTYIQKNVIDEMGPQTTYYILVKGFVNEKLTGLTFAVNKEFTNKPPVISTAGESAE